MGPRGTTGNLEGLSRLGVDLTDGVEVVLLVGLSGSESLALRRHDVDDDGMLVALGQFEGALDGRDVMTVNRTEVLDSQVREDPVADEGVLDAGLRRVHETEDLFAQRLLGDMPLHTIKGFLIVRIGANNGELVGQTSHRWGVGASVVIDDDDQTQILLIRDRVQGFPGHTTGECTITDDGDDRAVLATREESLGKALGPGQGGGRVRVLHPVMSRLGPARVSGQTAALTQLLEASGTSGQDLVDIALVTGVKDDGVMR